VYTLSYQVHHCLKCDLFYRMPILHASPNSWMRFCPKCDNVWMSVWSSYAFPETKEHYRALCMLMGD
jgi:uncharacterized paraquat-inducible protein A